MKDGFKAQMVATQEFFERSTRALTEEDSTYAPVEGVYTVANQVAHSAQTIDWFMEGAFNSEGFDMDFEGHDRKVREVQSLNEARAWFRKAVENALKTIDEKSEEEWAAPLAQGAVMGGQPRFSVFYGIADHTAHHRGALTVYTRGIGKQPPNPYMDA